MKRVIAFVLLTIIVFLTGCNGDKEEITALNEKISVLEESNTKLQEQIVTLEKNNTALEEDNTDLQEQITTSQQSNSELEKNNTKLGNELSLAKTELEKYAPIIDIEKEISLLNTQVANLEKLVQEKQTTLDDLSEKIDLVELEKKRKATEGTTVYEDNIVKINYVKIGMSYLNEKSVVLLVENKTNATMTIQHDALSLDHFDLGYILASEDISPQSKGYVFLSSDRINTDTPTVISGKLKVIDFDKKAFASYSISFVNVVVK